MDSLFDPAYTAWVEANPEQFSWMVFTLISQQAPAVEQTVVETGPAKGLLTNNAGWETWADDVSTFPTTNVGAKPQWDGRVRKMNFRASAFVGRVPGRRSSPGTAGLEADSSIKTEPPAAGAPGGQGSIATPQIVNPHGSLVPLDQGEEVRRNRNSFNFIVDNGLWNQQGLARWVANHQRPMKFSQGSIEIKAVWAAVTAADNDPSRPYHWNYGADGKKYKLVGLHVMTNALDQWTWSTWEWVGTPGRCNAPVPCDDVFGDANYASNHPANGPAPAPGLGYYTRDPLSAGVKSLFQQASLSNEWTGYRLRGVQILRGGAPTKPLLGNLRIEGANLIGTSSCIACHARAAVVTDPTRDCGRGIQPNGQGYTDYPPPGPVNPNASSFVWAFIRAADLNGKTACGN